MEFHMLNFRAFWSTCLHVIAIIFLLTNHFQLTIVAHAMSNQTDRFALLKLKESIVTDPQGSLNSWNESVHFCKWLGITCNTRRQRVTTLDLSDSGLHGTISPYVGNLSFLRFLKLQNNSFSGKIPQQVGHLFRLQLFNLSYNMLEGEVPVNLTLCPQLSFIRIGFNRLTGRIPSEIGSLKKLVYLNLEQNNLTGGIPASIANLSSLTVLRLGMNNLVGNLPQELGRLRSLLVFAIGPNNLSGTMPSSLFNISSMMIFSLTDNKFKGNLPPGIGLNMPNLQMVTLGSNEFFGEIPDSFSNASQLQILELTNNSFVGHVPKSLGNLPDLWWLNLAHNHLGSNSINDLGFITSLRNCSNLEMLDLNTNNFGGVLPDSVANFSIQLHSLYLGANQISGMIPPTLANLENLIVLALNKNQFTGVIPSSLTKLQKLQRLGLYENRLSGEIPAFMGNLTNLFQLGLQGNNLVGSIPPSITRSCPNLQYLSLERNRLSGEIPPDVIGLSSFRYLNLSQNSLTGSLPKEVGKLKSINALDISYNNLTGDIPETIGGCESLAFLSLRGNLFQGIIPPSVASLRGLEYLDLSVNNLSGVIPIGLQALLFLNYLNLSFNTLEGEVPKEGVFRNTSAVSCDGNIKLCGGISGLHLPACPIRVPKQRRLHGFKLKLTISLVVVCWLLFVVISTLYWRRRAQKTKPLSAESSINFLSNVSYQALHQATSGFSSSNQIGSGGFGTVYKGILDQEENNVVAIKVLNLRQKGAFKSFMAECNALRNIRHRNLVKILTCCSSIDYNGNDFKALVFEYMSNGSLEEWLHRENQSGSLGLLQRLNIAVDVACALSYLHGDSEPQIIHCDMKPSNILLDDNMVARLTDFGLARLIPAITDSSNSQSSTVGIKGTIGYAAPEYAVGSQPSKQGDVYSYGIIVLQLFTGRRPTDEMFVDGGNLHTFVKTAIPGRLMQIVDPTLIATLEETAPSTTTTNEASIIRGHGNEIDAYEGNIENENSSTMNTYVWNCILPALKIGLSCSEESPGNRISMEEVLKDIHHIKNAYSSIEIRREAEKKINKSMACRGRYSLG